MTRRALPSVAALSVLLSGCATFPVRPEPGVEGGNIWTKPGRRGIVVAAPHGTSDPYTAEIAAALAQRTGFGLVVASGFVLEADTSGRPGRRYQVNRPTEGVPGRPPAEEIATAAAGQVYAEFERRVLETAGAPLALYVEIHGNANRESAGRIEIATAGFDRDDAWRLRTLLELIRDARLRGVPEAPRLAVLVEPVDPLRYTASAAKQSGLLRLPRRALHIEIPRAARRDWRPLYTGVLADFLGQAAALFDVAPPVATPARDRP
jgi:hypothetical protein